MVKVKPDRNKMHTVILNERQIYGVAVRVAVRQNKNYLIKIALLGAAILVTFIAAGEMAESWEGIWKIVSPAPWSIAFLCWYFIVILTGDKGKEDVYREMLDKGVLMHEEKGKMV